MKYSEMLRLPQWQKKRLEIMQRDRWECKRCGSANKPLNVHHIQYIQGRKPWEYQCDNLITLCEDCHSFVHEPIKTQDPDEVAHYCIIHNINPQLHIEKGEWPFDFKYGSFGHFFGYIISIRSSNNDDYATFYYNGRFEEYEIPKNDDRFCWERNSLIYQFKYWLHVAQESAIVSDSLDIKLYVDWDPERGIWLAGPA